MAVIHDVVIVGGGGAGLRAAIAAAEADPDLSVAVVSKVHPLRSHTGSAQAGAAAVRGAGDSPADHARDTVSGGHRLADQDAVEALVREAPAELHRLERWGCPWSREPDGTIAVRPAAGMSRQRAWHAADRTGFHVLSTLFRASLTHPSVTRYDEWFVTRLLVDEGRVYGVVAIELMSGRIEPILGRAVVLASGGCGRIFPVTGSAGDGMALAYRAGTPLKDMEFVHYHPTGLAGTGIVITEAARAEGGWLVNQDGQRYLAEYGSGAAAGGELGPDDVLCRAFATEVEKGRTGEVAGEPVTYLDLRHLGERVIAARLPLLRELCRRYQRIDPARERIPVRPVVDAVLGGVGTDRTGATALAGLYAAGEVACVSVTGANRLAANSLPELLVFGARAGAAAARHATGAPEPPSAVLLQAHDERRRITRDLLGSTGGTERLADLRVQLWHTMESAAGVYREGPALAKAASSLRELQERLPRVVLDDPSRTFNTELVAALELSAMLDLAECLVHSALWREESRGMHQRTDFPARDDRRFLAHSVATRDADGVPHIGAAPVTVTRPPAELTRGR